MEEKVHGYRNVKTACAEKYQRLRNYKWSFVGCNRNKQERTCITNVKEMEAYS